MGSVSGGAAHGPSFLTHRCSPHNRSAPFFGLSPPPPFFHRRGNRRRLSTPRLAIPSARLDSPSEEESEQQQQQQQQLNLSVLRFTLGIPGFDESHLPRWIGYVVGSLILINHLAGWDSVTPAQLRSEGLGLCLAASAVALPFIGKFLKGANPMDRSALPAGNRQIFIMAENLAGTQKEDLAWASYVLLRNTNTMAVDAAKLDILNWFKGQIQQIGFSDLKETLYFPQGSDSLSWEFLPKGTLSLLVQPVQGTPYSSGEEMKSGGFVLLVSSANYAYSDKDRAWIRGVANKFGALSTCAVENSPW